MKTNVFGTAYLVHYTNVDIFTYGLKSEYLKQFKTLQFRARDLHVAQEIKRHLTCCMTNDRFSTKSNHKFNFYNVIHAKACGNFSIRNLSSVLLVSRT